MDSKNLKNFSLIVNKVSGALDRRVEGELVGNALFRWQRFGFLVFYLKYYKVDVDKLDYCLVCFFLKCAVMLMILILLWTSLCQLQIRKLTYDIFWVVHIH